MYKSLWDFGRAANAKYGAHAVDEYPTKILPQAASIIVERYSSLEDTILDPFCGGGTFAIEAKMHGRNSINYDINPNAIEITKKRLNYLTKNRMLEIISKQISQLEKEVFEVSRKYEKIRLNKEIEKLRKREEGIRNEDSIYNLSKHISEVADSRELKLPDESVDAIITDIPYASMIQYSDLEEDLSTILDYETFLVEIQKAFEKMLKTLKRGKYCIIFVADYRVAAARKILPVHSDVIQIMNKLGATLFDLYIWRYYRSGGFRPFGRRPFQAMNIHSYILVFYKQRGDEKFLGKVNRPIRYRNSLVRKISKTNEKPLDKFLANNFKIKA